MKLKILKPNTAPQQIPGIQLEKDPLSLEPGQKVVKLVGAMVQGLRGSGCRVKVNGLTV